MNEKERHVRENESAEERKRRLEREGANADLIADSLTAGGKNQKRKSTGGINRLWMWLGVLVLIFILLYWLFAIGTFGDLMDWFNG